MSGRVSCVPENRTTVLPIPKGKDPSSCFTRNTEKAWEATVPHASSFCSIIYTTVSGVRAPSVEISLLLPSAKHPYTKNE